MNKIYRVIWSVVTNTWVAVAENSKGRGKSGRGAIVRRTAIAAALSLSTLVSAAPIGGQVVSGTGSVSLSGNTTNINQSSANLSLNWQSFNIAPQETVNFVQPSVSAVAVNRIFDTNGSQILGHLNANGQVWLINPNGILFGQGAQVNVGGLVASTLDIASNSNSNGVVHFAGSGTGSIVNQGTINAAKGGYVAFIANTVNNSGTINAPTGVAGLAAGNAVTLTFADNALVHMQVDGSVLNSLAENGGLIQADGGMVILTAGARDSLLASVVNNTGIIEARTVENHNGTITLLGGMTAGTVNVGGTLDASALPSPLGRGAGGEGATGSAGASGGFIETSAAHVKVADTARVTTQAANGLAGTWLIDPNDYTIAATGGDMTGAAASTALASGNLIIKSTNGTSGTAGNINVNDVVSWSTNKLTLNAQNNINITAAMNGSGSASLALLYGQSSTTGGISTYNVNAAVNLPAGNNFSTQLGSTGTPVNYTVITALGAAADATTAPATMTLQGMNTGLAGNYVLGANIDATGTSSWNTNAGFTPVGNSTSSTSMFTGTFDGLGHTINGLTINLPTTNYVGLFGYTYTTSAIRNVGLVGGSVSGGADVGGLVGYNNSGTVSNSYATGSVSGGSYVGGLMGFNNHGTISNSYATGSVSGVSAVGGLVGDNNGGTISNSYATGSVSGGSNSSHVGGLVGDNIFGTISNSYATGSVSGGSYVGELVGDNNGTVSNSYATGSVIGSGSDVGGLAGISYSTISNSYATGSVSGVSAVGGLVGDNNGGTISNSYATGSVSGSGSKVGGLAGANYGPVSNSYATGSVSGSSYVGGLAGFTVNTVSNSYATGSVSGSSDVGGLAGGNHGTISNSYWNSTVNATGIGFGTTTGTNVSGLTTTQMQTAANFIGFTFTTTPGATGNNWVMVDDAGMLNNTYGSLGATFPMLASEYSTTINNAHQLQLMAMNLAGNYTLGSNIDASNTATATALKDVWSTTGGFVPVGYYFPNQFTGTFDGLGHTINGLTINLPSVIGVGLFGYGNSTSKISNVGLVGGSVSGKWYVGGLMGANYGKISNSYATGSVSGSSYVGGLVGYNSNGTINNSYATGGVSAPSYVGGLVGGNAATISNSYATGSVSSTGNYVGGLVGNNYVTGVISNSFYDKTVNPTLIGIGAVSGGVADVAGVVWGMSTSDMKLKTNFIGATAANGNHNPGWDFTTPVWGFSSGVNSGYPILCNVTAACALLSTTIYLDLLTGSSIYGNTPTYTYGYYTTATYGSGTAITDAAPAGTVIWSNAPTATSNVGNYSMLYSSGINLGNNAYTLLPGNAVNWSVTSAPLSVIGTTAADKTYNGNATAALSGGTLLGTVNGDILTLTQTGTFASKNVGNNIAVIANDSLNGAAASNYTLTQPTGLSANITPAPLTVTGLSGTNRAYNGTTVDALTGSAILSGLVSGESLTLGNTANGVSGSANAGTQTVMTALTIANGTGGLASNYSLTQPTLANVTIAKAPLTISATSGSKIYDGTTGSLATPTVTSGTLFGSDSLSALSESFASKNVMGSNGSTLAVNNTYILSDGNSGGNYNVTLVTKAGTITPKAITESGLSVATSKVYDGITNAAISGTATLATETAGAGSATDGKAYTGDVVAVTGTVTAKYNSQNVTQGNTVTFGGLALNNSNYTLTMQAPVAATITPKPITETGLSVAASRVYDGTTNATVTGKAVLAATETVGTGTATDGKAYAAASIKDMVAIKGTASAIYNTKDVATANSVTFSGLTLNNSNYTLIMQAPVAATISPALLTYIATQVSFVSGQTPSGLTGSVTGFMSSDTLANSTTGTLAWTTPATSSSPAGLYNINGNGLTASNYTFTQAIGNATALTIQGGPL